MRFFVITIMMALLTPGAVARSIYLNGDDASSTRNQQLKKVDVRIDEYGDVYIQAPHYRVEVKKPSRLQNKALVELPEAPVKNLSAPRQIDRRRPVDETAREALPKDGESLNPFVPGSHPVPTFMDPQPTLPGEAAANESGP